jgi:hypothetical protein
MHKLLYPLYPILVKKKYQMMRKKGTMKWYLFISPPCKLTMMKTTIQCSCGITTMMALLR